MNTRNFSATFSRFAAVVAGMTLWALASPAFAQSGQFTYVIGDVRIERAGQAPFKPDRGTTVSPRDVIVTGATGMAQLAMVDLAKLSLRSNSRLVVAQYPVAAGDPPGALLNLVRGTLRSFTALLTGPNKVGYRMQTKVATVGIRGSGGILEVLDDGTDTTNMHTIEGNHIVASIDGNFPAILTNPNETVQIVRGQAPRLIPTPPSLLDAGKLMVGGKEKKSEFEDKDDKLAGQTGSSGTSGQVLGGNGLGYSVIDATTNVGSDPINLQHVVFSSGGTTVSDQAIPAGITLDANGALRAYTAYAGSQSGTGANVVGGTASDLQTVTIGANTTIVLGRWSGASSFGFGSGNGGNGTSVGGSVHWAYGGAGFPSYLSDVLTGTATYTRAAATTPTNQFGTLGTLTSATLDVNFTARTLNTVIAVTMPAGNGTATGSWNIAANNVPFAFNTFFASGSRVVVTNGAGTSSASSSGLGGSIEGSFVGNTLNGAILGYGIFDQSSAASQQRINGVVAFSGPSQNSATPYRDGLVSDPAASLAGASYIRSFATTNRQAEVTVGDNGVVSAFTAPFPVGNELAGHRPYAQGTATIVDNGFDPTTGLVWGRWAGGSATVGGQTVGLTDRSLHYIFSPTTSGPVSLPLTGTGVYDVVGSTRPTDLAGHTGVFNSASLNANFTARTVDTSVNITINGQTWNGAANGVPIYRDQYFSAYAGGPSIAGIPQPAILNITCTPSCTPSRVTGSLDGFFTGRRGNGAGVMYNMNNNAGAVAFSRRGG